MRGVTIVSLAFALPWWVVIRRTVSTRRVGMLRTVFGGPYCYRRHNLRRHPLPSGCYPAHILCHFGLECRTQFAFLGVVIRRTVCRYRIPHCDFRYCYSPHSLPFFCEKSCCYSQHILKRHLFLWVVIRRTFLIFSFFRLLLFSAHFTNCRILEYGCYSRHISATIPLLRGLAIVIHSTIPVFSFF